MEMMTKPPRILPEETPVAMTYDRTSFAVMMATPQDLEDFAAGFSLTEGIVQSMDEVGGLEVLNLDDGMECRMNLVPDAARNLEARRRRIAGPVGCGLCGMDSIAEAVRRPRKVGQRLRISAGEINAAMARLPELQPLNRQTRAVHAAGFLVPGQPLALVREDVGRHNALDKLLGAVVRGGLEASTGAVLLTSRVSVELVQKTAALGGEMIIAVSAPTSRAVRDAEEAGITLVAIARADGFELFTHPWRVI